MLLLLLLMMLTLVYLDKEERAWESAGSHNNKEFLIIFNNFNLIRG